MKKIEQYIQKLLLSSLFILATTVQANNQNSSYDKHPLAQAFIKELVAEGFSANEVKAVLKQAVRKEKILEAIARPAERRLTWGEYRNIFMKPLRIKRGVEFWRENVAVLDEAERVYSIPAEYIVAIIGVETYYGRIKGSYRVVDALATLGFDYPPRAKFFRKQLKEYFYMTKKEGIDPLSIKGSYAGAMGFGQFIPSSFRSFAVDFDKDGQRDIWTNKADAIGSVANYFARHGWVKNEPVISSVKQPLPNKISGFNKSLKPKLNLKEWAQKGLHAQSDVSDKSLATLMRLESAKGYEYKFGLHNFYVITRYNHSSLYAMAVHELSQAIKTSYER